MADKNEGQEKTEKATPKKRQEAREKGQVARSQEVSSVAVLLASFVVLYFSGQSWLLQMQEIIRKNFIRVASFRITPIDFTPFFISLVIDCLKLLGPFFLIILSVAILANILQTGWVFSWEPLAPKLDKLDPIKGFKNKFLSKKTLVEIVKGILKIFIIGYVGYRVIRAEFFNLPPLVDTDAYTIVSYTARISGKLFFNTCVVMIILAVLDYGFQLWEFEESIKMTKQEVKDEFKQMEGDPQIKGRIKSIQRQLAKQRMMSEVPKADVVITNPTHIAVAIKYNASEMSSPKVIAKGARIIAENIKVIALKHNIPIIEDKPLARALYKLVEIGQEIPPNLYRAVAEILAYVYRLKNKVQGNRFQGSSMRL